MLFMKYGRILWTFLWDPGHSFGLSQIPDQVTQNRPITLQITGEIEIRKSCQNRSLENIEATETPKQQKEEVGITLPKH